MTRTLKDQLETEIAAAEAREEAKPGWHKGADWDQLSEAEEAVFAIDRDRFPRMVMTWHCYEGFKRISDSTVWDEEVIEQARRQHPQWCGEGISQAEFSEFATALGELTCREAHAIYARQEFWCVRNGIAEYGDEIAGG